MAETSSYPSEVIQSLLLLLQNETSKIRELGEYCLYNASAQLPDKESSLLQLNSEGNSADHTLPCESDLSYFPSSEKNFLPDGSCSTSDVNYPLELYPFNPSPPFISHKYNNAQPQLIQSEMNDQNISETAQLSRFTDTYVPEQFKSHFDNMMIDKQSQLAISPEFIDNSYNLRAAYSSEYKVNAESIASEKTYAPSESSNHTNLDLLLKQSDSQSFLTSCHSFYQNMMELLERNHVLNPSEKTLKIFKDTVNYYISTISPKDEQQDNFLSHDSANQFTSTRSNRGGNNAVNFSNLPVLAHPDEFHNPSSFLKIYGDPLCSSDKLPFKGVDGNWECKSCKNVNYPRRFRCNLCNSHRDKDGDMTVSNYVRYVYSQYRMSLSKFNDHTQDKSNSSEDLNHEIPKFYPDSPSRSFNNKKKFHNNFNKKKVH